ncbi:MAG: hypothetical protein RBU27_12995 [Bacteroidota bacterium]|jgi:hypothetical protein|nr:hypothetical protein [Bacteroidota bacterium]
MNEFSVSAKPGKLIPVLIGGTAMVVVSAFPIINLVNLLCCAGIMGAAVLGVWFYRRGFPAGLPFTIGDGTAVGALSGVIGGAMMTVVAVVTGGLLSDDFAVRLQDELDNAFAQAGSQTADPAAIEATEQLFMQIAGNPMLLVLVVLFTLLLLFTAFGTLGGLIGGAIFKTTPPPPGAFPVENHHGV